jgi:hypothetical protein
VRREFHAGRPVTLAVALLMGLLALASAAILCDLGLPDPAFERRDPTKEAFRAAVSAGLVSCGALGALLAWAAATPRPSLAVDEEGLHLLVLPRRPMERIPWEEVGRVEVSPLWGVDYLWVHLVERPDHQSDRSTALRFTIWLNRVVRLPALSYVRGAFAAPLEEVRDAIEQARSGQRLEAAHGGDPAAPEQQPGGAVG